MARFLTTYEIEGPLPMAKITTIDKLSALFSAQRKAAIALRTDIDSLESEIIGLRLDLDRVRRAPVDAASISRRVDSLLASAMAEAEAAFNFEAIATAEYHAVDVFPRDSALPRSAALGLAIMFGDAEGIRAGMVGRLTASGATGLSHDERALEVKRLEAAISERERVLERIHREAEAAGVSIPRRPDADPAALLMPDSEV
jgi:hypothetical protein